ncbi:aldehyde dehydrogenase family protein [Mesorhizobium sp. CCNWLW179-1]|uniref:aldehyde dehydrogenase family protein n=1 Tax=unclassified Mesorhizobium TaxID=325217 RepID=UPI0030145748
MGVHLRFEQALTRLEMVPRQLLIGGKWQGSVSGETFSTVSPLNGQDILEVAKGGSADVDKAVAAARKAFEGGWSTMSPFERQSIILHLAEVVERNYETIAFLDTLDMGAPISRTRGGLRRALQLLRYYAGQATAIHGETISTSSPGDPFACTLKEPLGVVGAITPWNAPFGMCVWKVGPALATGCTVVLKPAEQSPLSALYFGQLCLEAGVPEGVVNVVTGFAEAGARLAEHPDVDKVSFTGSTTTGQHIIRASAGNVKRLSLELGGKSPHIVFADADLDKAAPIAAMAVFQNSGQICSAGTRLFVEDSIHDEFLEKVVEHTGRLVVGDALDEATQLGPVIESAHMEKVLGYIETGVSEGASLATGGKRLDEQSVKDGYYIQPTIFSNVSDDMKIAKEEIFGPVLSVLRFSSLDEVISRANATSYGLGSGVWTTNVAKAHTVGRRLKNGSVWVNCYQMMDPAVPFGGYKMSGYGRESGSEHVKEYLNTKGLWIATQ